ncbi:O-antigen ligase family protein [Myroides odoratimimus]|uniref:O-antigen ligase family protein n=1 Tax=Myroides odoratimimus TaxID=76832 RepID=UPI002DB83EA9|nr:O-antigen ligase family protein [Myroides odoratimimus]MEC4052146.1 O-antigen ligase family protein [Myroides odoratimimus]
MYLLIKKWYTLFFFIGIFLVPFNQVAGLSMLREYSHESAIYCWLLGGILAIMEDVFLNKRIIFPYKSKVIWLWSLFFGWSLLTYFFNYSEIQVSYFKHRSGNNKFIFQAISIILTSYFLIYYFSKVLKNSSIICFFYKIRRIVFMSFIIVFVYGLLEFLVNMYSIRWVKDFIEWLNFMPILDKREFYGERLSSVSFEVPALGNYLIFAFGWMFSYVFTENNWFKRILPSIAIVLLTILSGARAALVIISIQVLVGILLYIKYKEIKVNLKYLLGIVFSLLVIGSLNFNKIVEISSKKLNFFNVESNISNKTRFGMQYATIQVFKENPIVGVGLGQNGFHKRNHYPNWAIENNSEFTDWYLNEEVYSFAPDFNLYLKVLAETGIIGFVLFCSFLFLLIRKVFVVATGSSFDITVISVVLFISIIGYLINWFQLDYFRQLGFWLCVVILIRIENGESV